MAIAVLPDHHALGKRIVYSILRAGGFKVMDFGQGLSVDNSYKLHDCVLDIVHTP